MPRILFILVLLAVGYLLLKSWQNKQRLRQQKKQHDQQRSQSTVTHTRILRCEHCGVHVPETEVVKHGDHLFCSLEHAQQAQLTRD